MNRKKSRQRRPVPPAGLRVMTPLDIARIVGVDAGWDAMTVDKVARGDVEPLSDEARRSPLLAILPRVGPGK